MRGGGVDGGCATTSELLSETEEEETAIDVEELVRARPADCRSTAGIDNRDLVDFEGIREGSSPFSSRATLIDEVDEDREAVALELRVAIPLRESRGAD